MTQQLTTTIVNNALTYALDISKQRFLNKPFSVAICDNNGNLLTFFRIEGAKLLTIELTQRKAYTSARLGCTTQAFLQRLQTENLAISYFADDKFTALPGGIPLTNKNNQIIGAVAVGGISVAGDVEAAELIADFMLEQINN